MQKILFNDRFSLTELVLNGQKTMTRRIIPGSLTNETPMPKYNVGEKVAIAQSYSVVSQEHSKAPFSRIFHNFINASDNVKFGSGFNNKMFVKARLMPHFIEITDIRKERLQDISEEDCLREGIIKWLDCFIVPGIIERNLRNNVCFESPKEAFKALISRIAGKQVWADNPFVYAYEFILVQ